MTAGTRRTGPGRGRGSGSVWKFVKVLLLLKVPPLLIAAAGAPPSREQLFLSVPPLEEQTPRPVPEPENHRFYPLHHGGKAGREPFGHKGSGSSTGGTIIPIISQLLPQQQEVVLRAVLPSKEPGCNSPIHELATFWIKWRQLSPHKTPTKETKVPQRAPGSPQVSCWISRGRDVTKKRPQSIALGLTPILGAILDVAAVPVCGPSPPPPHPPAPWRRADGGRRHGWQRRRGADPSQ